MIFANSAKKPESTLLALWECETIQSLWNRTFSWLDRSQSTRASSGDLVTLIRIRPHLSDIFAPTAWSLWCRRNKVHLNEAAQPLERIAEEALPISQNLQECTLETTQGKWHPLQNQL